MKFVNIDFPLPKNEVLSKISDNNFVNEKVRFEEGNGVPHMKVREKKNGRIRITCEMLGKPTRDNGFLVGTYFSGKLTEKDGRTKLKGIILTAPIYHFILILLLAVFVWRCIDLKGISVVPVFLVIFDIFMFKDEFKKQGYIMRYLFRASRKMN